MASKLYSILLVLICMTGSVFAACEHPLKAIVFDFGGVIAKTDTNEVADFISTQLNISKEDSVNIIKQIKEDSIDDNESIFWKDYADKKKITLRQNWEEQLNEARAHALKMIPGMVGIVKDLQKQGYQTALLSNVRKSQANIKRKLGLYDIFTPVLLSYEIGVKKPDSKAFQILLDRLKLPPEQILFVDNKLANVEAARKMGMDAFEFQNPTQFVEELKKRGINLPEVNLKP